MNESFADAPEMYDVLLTNRNKAWVSEIERVLAEETGTVFVAVGAGHLSGRTSVTTLLEAAGHTVDRL